MQCRAFNAAMREQQKQQATHKQLAQASTTHVYTQPGHAQGNRGRQLTSNGRVPKRMTKRYTILSKFGCYPCQQQCCANQALDGSVVESNCTTQCTHHSTNAQPKHSTMHPTKLTWQRNSPAHMTSSVAACQICGFRQSSYNIKHRHTPSRVLAHWSNIIKVITKFSNTCWQQCAGTWPSNQLCPSAVNSD
jgi:hypothetical protein